MLDQLSLTAWVPAALLVANIYLVAGMYMVRETGAHPTMDNLGKAVLALNEKPVGVIISVAAGLVLATLVTQSFEFASIRFLEGYWGGSLFMAWPTCAGISLQKLRKWLTRRRAEKLTRRAFLSARLHVAQALKENPELLSTVLLVGSGAPVDHVARDLRASAETYFHGKKWMMWAAPHLRHRAGALALRLAAFPARSSRLMPTRLGNTLRASEEKLKGQVAGSHMRGYLYSHLDAVGPELMHQHTLYRNRLDMFAVMTVLCALLATANTWLLPAVLPTPAVAGAASGLLALSLLSYRGAVAAAVDYGAILVAIDAGIRGKQRT